MMFAVPADTAVTRPVDALTLATPVFELDHAMARPVSTVLFASLVTAVAVVVVPATMLAAASDTDTFATGTTAAVTVNVAVPVLPSLVAVIVVVPAATPVMAPVVALIVAADGLELDHATARPVSTLPLASRVTAVALVFAPETMLVAASETLSVATGTTTDVTLTEALPVFPSLVALIVALPFATPVTSPVVALTVATAGFELANVTTLPVNTPAEASHVVAVACVVPPGTRLDVPSATETDATGTVTVVTVIVAVPTTPSLVALMVELPAPTPVMRPLVGFTLATAALELDQVTTRP
jgi:hypothetical protein